MLNINKHANKYAKLIITDKLTNTKTLEEVNIILKTSELIFMSRFTNTTGNMPSMEFKQYHFVRRTSDIIVI